MTEDSKIEAADQLQSETQRRYGFMGKQNHTPDEDIEAKREYGFMGQHQTPREEQEAKREYGFMNQKESGEKIRKKHGFMGTDDKSNIETLFGMK